MSSATITCACGWSVTIETGPDSLARAVEVAEASFDRHAAGCTTALLSYHPLYTVERPARPYGGGGHTWIALDGFEKCQVCGVSRTEAYIEHTLCEGEAP